MSIIKVKQLFNPCLLRATGLGNISRYKIAPKAATILCYKVDQGLIANFKQPARNFNWRSFLGFIQNPVVLAKKDGIPANTDYQTVYNARTMSFYIVCANYYVVFSALATMVYIYSEFGDVTPLAQTKPLNDTFFQFHGTFEHTAAISLMILLNCTMLYVIHRFPLRIYHSESRNNFIVVFNQILMPWKSNRMNCNPGGVKLLGDSTFHELTGSYKLGKKRIYLNVQYFRYPAWYNAMLGYV